jgi:YfiR/HmsC-like
MPKGDQIFEFPPGRSAGSLDMAKIFRWICWVQIHLITAAALSPCYGQITISPNQEYKTKANFLVNFAKFTSWPADVLAGSDRFKLCVLGKDPFGLFLDLLAIRGVKGHEIDLLRLRSSDEAADCHLLFLAPDAVSHEGRVPPTLSRRGLLVVTDTPGLAERGAVANLVMEDGNMRFEINVNAARRAALILNTQLLRLGRLTTDADLERP